MTVARCRKEMSYREYQAWQLRLEEAWNDPSRGDYYLMQIAAEICRGRVKDPNDVKVGSFKIPITFDRPKPKVPVSKKMIGWAKSIWAARVGLK
jgi:hypothetical protein